MLLRTEDLVMVFGRELCREPIEHEGLSVVCTRVPGHDGEHIAKVWTAARADGVCVGCGGNPGDGHTCYTDGPHTWRTDESGRVYRDTRLDGLVTR